MTDLPNTANQQAQTPKKTQNRMSAHLDASKEMVNELSDQELEAVSGGDLGTIVMTLTSMMGGGGSNGGTGIGSTAANHHTNIINNHNDSAASSANGNINIGNKIHK